MKRKDELVLITLWAMLYIPYIIYGGLIRDDLGFLTSPPEFPSYPEFQWYISSNRDMTARPVSALVHGLCYWYFGTTPWVYHLVNLTLFLGSVLFFYRALRKIASREVTLISAIFAMVYPCASGTVFAAIMKNSNLAALFWSSALFLAGTNHRWRHFLNTILLLLSLLSYETFGPLFLLNVLVGFSTIRADGLSKRRLLDEAMPVLISVTLCGLYRVQLEKTIFHTGFSRLVLSSPVELFARFVVSIYLGIKIAFVDSLQISFRALRNLALVSPYYLIVVAAGLALLGFYLYRLYMFGPANEFALVHPAEAGSRHRPRTAFRLSLGMAIVLLFGAAHLVYVFSAYVPDPRGFENRTLGAIRFVTALLFAVLLQSAGTARGCKSFRRIGAAVLIGLSSLFACSMIGQREAWIAAARHNDYVLDRINLAIRREQLDRVRSLTLVAILPDEFPGQVNQEPIFGAPWDITTALSLTNPDIAVRANVYNSTATTDVHRISIVTLGHSWEAAYPFWLYSFENNRLYLVTTEQDWSEYARDCLLEHDPSAISR